MILVLNSLRQLCLLIFYTSKSPKKHINSFALIDDMTDLEIKHIHQDLETLKSDVALIKHILTEEGELTVKQKEDWKWHVKPLVRNMFLCDSHVECLSFSRCSKISLKTGSTS